MRLDGRDALLDLTIWILTYRIATQDLWKVVTRFDR